MEGPNDRGASAKLVHGSSDTMSNLPNNQDDLLQGQGRKLYYGPYTFADVAAVAVPQVAEGLSADEILALVAEGRPFRTKGESHMMDWVMKFVMGGWIPQGKRSQVLAFVTALTAMLMVVLEWGSGTMDFMHFVEAIKDKWAVFVAAYGVFFVAEKIDSK